MRRQRGVLLLVGAAIVGSITWAVVRAATPPMSPAAEPVVDLVSMTGIGERLIIVVGGLHGSRVEAEKAVEALTFGDMQGFYVDSTDNYILAGYYQQTSPDAIAAHCGDLPGLGIDCPPGAAVVAIQPIEFRYRDIHALGDFLATSTSGTCGELGLPPCVARRLSILVEGPPFHLASGRYLLLSAFRTIQGAAEFAELARDRGAEVAAIRIVKTGGPYVGLGQEAHPDGVSGPLLAPLPDADKYQK